MDRIFPQGTFFRTPYGMFKVNGIISDEDYPGLSKLDSEKRWYAPFCNLQQMERIFNPQNREDILLKKQMNSVLDNMRILRTFYKRYNTTLKWDIEEQFDKYIFVLFRDMLIGTEYFEQFGEISCGTTYDSDANGQCIKTEFGNIITISTILEDFLYYMNLFYRGIFVQDIPYSVAYNARCIAIRIMLHTEALDFDLDPRGNVPEEIEKKVRMDTRGEMLFVVAHEYAHNILGHLDDNNIIKYMNGGEETVIYNQSQIQEFEADIEAIRILEGALGRENAIIGAVNFFMSLDLFEQAKEQIFPSISSYKTHPSAAERIKNIYKIFKPGEVEKEKYMNTNNIIKQNLMEDISINMEQYEEYGSVYLGEWHKKMLRDRIDY